MNCYKSFLIFSARFVKMFCIVLNQSRFIFCNLLINKVVSFEFTVFCICTFELFVYLLSIFVYQPNNAGEHMFILQEKWK